MATIKFFPHDSTQPDRWEVQLPNGTEYEGEIQYASDGRAIEQPPDGGWLQPGFKKGQLKALIREALSRAISR